MFWFSAEKHPSIFFEFFNRIDPTRSLDKTILTTGVGTLLTLMGWHPNVRSVDTAVIQISMSNRQLCAINRISGIEMLCGKTPFFAASFAVYF